MRSFRFLRVAKGHLQHVKTLALASVIGRYGYQVSFNKPNCVNSSNKTLLIHIVIA